MNREALILAGGLGTRLRGTIGEIPKPMAPVGDRPFLEYLLYSLSQQQFHHVVLSVGYRHEVIRDHFGPRYRNLSITYSIEDTPLGTGGGIRMGLEHCQATHVFIFNGDTFFRIDLGVLETFHHAQGGTVSLALRRLNDCSRYGTVLMKGSTITGFASRGGKKEGVVNAGIYLLRRDLILLRNLPRRGSFETEVLAPMAQEGLLSGLEFDGYFIDIGIPGDYRKAQAELPPLLPGEKGSMY